jgi:hypothetical protein
MTENYTDYDLENAIRAIAERLRIEGFSIASGVRVNDLFSKIQERCPQAAGILLERTFEKDKLKSYLDRSPPLPRLPSGAIDGEGDATFETHWRNLVELHPILEDAINHCLSRPI